jgi:hypothetical protein
MYDNCTNSRKINDYWIFKIEQLPISIKFINIIPMDSQKLNTVLNYRQTIS